MNLPDIVRIGPRARRILSGLVPSAMRRGQVERLLDGLGGRYEESLSRNRFEPRFYLRVSAQLH